jgi:hypothetical protein
MPEMMYHLNLCRRVIFRPFQQFLAQSQVVRFARLADLPADRTFSASDAPRSSGNEIIFRVINSQSRKVSHQFERQKIFFTVIALYSTI